MTRWRSILFAAATATVAVLSAPLAGAQTDPGLPQCTDTGGDAALGGTTTECATPGNVQINATPSEPTYLYPWDDEFYGPALIMGGDEGYRGGGGGGFHGGGGAGGAGGHGGR